MSGGSSGFGDFAVAELTGVGGLDGVAATRYGLAPVRPSPARDRTYFTFSLPRADRVRLSVIDIQGRERRVVAEGEFSAGRHEIEASGERGPDGLPSGTYFARLLVAGQSFQERFLVVH
jgi:hypothetical protein